ARQSLDAQSPTPAYLPVPAPPIAANAPPAPPPSIVFPDGGFPPSPPPVSPAPPVAANAPQTPPGSTVFPDGSFPPSPAPVSPPPPAAGGGLYSPVPAIFQPSTGNSTPRSVADSAPPGIQRRPPQAGAAYPLYAPLEIPRVPTTPEEKSKFVTAGIFPGTYL